jgi:hypothetical protein
MWFFNRNRDKELQVLQFEVDRLKGKLEVYKAVLVSLGEISAKKPRLKKDGTLAKKVGRKRLTKKV